MEEKIRHLETNYSAFMSSENGKEYPVFRNLSFNNITRNNADEAVTMQGTIHQPVENIRFENIDIKARRGMTFNWVNGLSLNNVHDEQVENPIIPPNALFTRSHKAGLESEYFNNKDLKGEPVFTRIDRQINFNYWAGNPPAPGVNHDKFSVRWKGLLKVPKSGTYKIGLEADDGFRLYLDNKLIVDAWENYKKGTFKGLDVQLEQEKFYDLKIEYFEDLGFGYALFSLKPGELKPGISDVYNQTDAKNINLRQKEYTSHSKDDALKWQIELRSQLFNLLKMDDLITDQGKPSLGSSVPITEDRTNYVIKELEINSTIIRRIKIVITIPKTKKKKLPAVVCIAGHGGNRLSVYEKESIYHGFATELAKKEFITISTDVGQHNIYESNRTLMGERLWDVMRCVDYLESLPMVDESRIGCAGLSLGGEMAMWLGAMDQRIKVTVSSGFLTYMDQMEQNHCMCWKFDGLRELVDYPDIYSLIAPRFLQCQNGLKEPTNGFTPKLAKEALKEIKPIYMDFNKGDNVELVIHEGEHEIALLELLSFFKEHL